MLDEQHDSKSVQGLSEQRRLVRLAFEIRLAQDLGLDDFTDHLYFMYGRPPETLR